MGADLDAVQAQLAHAACGLLDRQLRVLQRHRAERQVMCRVTAADLGGVLVEHAVQVERLGAGRPVAEHHRHGGNHLHGNIESGVVVDTQLSIPGARLDLAEELTVLEDPVAPVAVIDAGEALIVIAGGQIRPIAGQHVRMGVDLESHNGFCSCSRPRL